MDTLTIRQKLHEYIDEADDVSLVELYSDINKETSGRYEWWNDKEMVAELKQIADDMDSGKDPGMTLDESMEHLLKRLKKNG